jgi:heme/copper-type cytochrome/quinol oxidase subunit 2
MKTRIVFQAAFAAAVWAVSGAAQACPVCINGAGGEKLLDAFNWSVLFLMAMPYTIVFAVIGFFVYAYRRAEKKQRAEESAVMSPAHDLS